MTPAQELRAAAAELRRRAKDATSAEGEPPGWSGVGAHENGHGALLCGGPGVGGYRTGIVFQFREDCEKCDPPSLEDVAWMETVHPGVAEPLARWLEIEAYMADNRGLSAEGHTVHALKVARAITGGAS